MFRASFIALLLLVSGAALAAPRVSVQPFNGPEPESQLVRKWVARTLAKKGFRVLTSIPAVAGTGQYPEIARTKELNAFVVADTEVRGKRVAVTFLVWQGVDGNVIGRWEMAAPKNKLGKTLGKEFWKRLGPALEQAVAPPSTRLGPAPPMRIDASSPHDSAIAPTVVGKRQATTDFRYPAPNFR